jgi:8-hydroxy-5-deazaflavin:NADPH oxidoreductase
MSYSIVGFGAVGQALAREFARKNIEVAVASSRISSNSRKDGPRAGASVRFHRYNTSEV